MMKMITLVAALTAVGTTFCGAASAQVTPTDERHTNLENPPADLPSEAQVAGILDAVDQDEIDAAQKAVERSKNEEVLAFARQMIADHGESRRKLGEVGIQPTDSDMSRKLKERAKTTSRRLSTVKDTAFDRAYISAMVDGHTSVLEKIDKKLVPAAKTGALATHLQDRRAIIESHLEHARRLKTSLGTR